MADLNPPEEMAGAQIKSAWKWRSLFRDIPDIGTHTINLVLALFSVWLVHVVLGRLLGKDAKFFDWIPIRYVTDFADVVLILKFIWHVIKNFNR